MTKPVKPVSRTSYTSAVEIEDRQLDRLAAGVVDPTNPTVVYVGGSRVADWDKVQELRAGK